MDEDIDALRAEVAALRAELAARTSVEPPSRDVSRRRLLTGLAGIGAGAVAGIATASPAGADDGDNLVLGEENTTTGFLVRNDPPGSPHLPTGTVLIDDPLVWLEDSDGDALAAVSSDRAIAASGAIEGVVAYGGASGIVGASDGLVAVFGEATDAAVGLAGRSETGPALWLSSSGGPHMELVPHSPAGPPTGAPTYTVGTVSLDETGDLWVCVAAGDPGTWTRLLREDSAEGRTVPITPIRALDTRVPGGRANGAPSIPGQTHGPLHGGQTVTLDLAGTGPIPATATGIIGNAIVLAPTTNGYLRIIPAGTGATTSAVSFTKATTTSNAYTTALSPTGLTATAPITPTATYHLVLDITAYIT